MELVDLVNSGELTNDFRCLIFILGSLTVTLNTPALLDLFLLMLVFVLQCLSLHWEILIVPFCDFPLISCKLKTGCPISMHRLWLFSCWLWCSRWSFERCSMGDVPFSLNSVLLLLVNFVSGFRLELMTMYISFIISIRSNLTHLCGFHLLVLLLWFIEITFFICTNRINLVNLK